MEKENRLERGYKKLQEIDGKAGEEVKNSLSDICPDLVKYMIEYSFGDIYSRNGLDLFSPDLVKFIVYGQADIMTRNNLSKNYRKIATIAALTALGNAKPQLKFHIGAGLNIGENFVEKKKIFFFMKFFFVFF
ncbi:carboxymuconolactone decarboxylase family protein [Clostridium autoethanogenum]|uniref:carboxymuconolactone decarboxylase family protein n=1 Tax=Clostridium autoethanogenum TaxID=84023 RepID=UPI001FA98F32|nr:carboxymuconolactone decarboxylase family protein [Clostridium autoethanogenum]